MLSQRDDVGLRVGAFVFVEGSDPLVVKRLLRAPPHEIAVAFVQPDPRGASG